MPERYVRVRRLSDQCWQIELVEEAPLPTSTVLRYFWPAPPERVLLNRYVKQSLLADLTATWLGVGDPARD